MTGSGFPAANSGFALDAASAIPEHAMNLRRVICVFIRDGWFDSSVGFRILTARCIEFKLEMVMELKTAPASEVTGKPRRTHPDFIPLSRGMKYPLPGGDLAGGMPTRWAPLGRGYLNPPRERKRIQIGAGLPRRSFAKAGPLGLALGLLVALLALPLSAAEPVPDPSELPRIPATEPADALKTFKVKPGFRLELVASEPLVTDPVSLSFDADGRLYVVEMRGYSERRTDSLGQIRLLEDTDNDGRMDKSTVFAAGLNWPTAVFCYDGGVFVGVTPDLWFMKDTDGDGVADLKKVVYTGFGTDRERLNVQAMFNSFRWGLDNRIHGATASNGGTVSAPDHKAAKPVRVRGRNFAFDPRSMAFTAEDSTAQHGMSFDDWGRKFVCSNSSHLQAIMYDTAYGGRNPQFPLPGPRINAAADGAAAEVHRISPDEPWRIVRTRWRVTGAVRGVVEGGGRVSGYFTAATGVTIFRGNAYGDDFIGNAFIGDAGSNLIHRKRISYNGVEPIGRRPADEQDVEFIASSDNWFRPVQFANAPDGCLYVADMYRETIEHPWSIPESIKKHLDLNSGNDRGRIWRIVPDGFKQPGKPKLKDASTAQLVATLAHPNGWHRDTAARLLFERQDKSALAPLVKLAKASKSAAGRQHALHALNGLGMLKLEHVHHALSDRNAHVRRHALKLLELPSHAPDRIDWRLATSLANDPDPGVRLQLAFTLGICEHDLKEEALATLAMKDGGDKWIQAAIMNSIGDDPLSLFSTLTEKDAASAGGFLTSLAELIGRRNHRSNVASVVKAATRMQDKGAAYSVVRALSDGLRRSRSSLTHHGQDAPLAPLYQSAGKTLGAELARGNDKSKPALRLAAIQMLGIPDFYRQKKTDVFNPFLTLDLLFRSNALSASETIALIRSVEGIDNAIITTRLLALAAEGDNASVQNEAILKLLARKSRTSALLKAIEAGSIRASLLSASQVQSLRGNRDKAIKALALSVLGAPPSRNRQAVVDSFLPAMRLKGKAANGKALYQQLCVSCHKLGAEGHALGPDLVTMKSMGREKILVNILDPNREVAPQYYGYSIDTRDGENHSGLIASEDGQNVTLKAAFGTTTAVSRSDIAAMKSTGMSIMPEGLEAGLDHQKMADLIEFIVTAKQ